MKENCEFNMLVGVHRGCVGEGVHEDSRNLHESGRFGEVSLSITS